MQEILTSFLPPFITDNIFVPYPFALILIVEWLRYQFDGIDNRIKPKHQVVIVGALLAVAFYFIETMEGVHLSFKILIISFFFSTMMYEYLVKPVKEKFFPKYSEKQKQ